MYQEDRRNYRDLDRQDSSTSTMRSAPPVEGRFGTVESVKILGREERDLDLYIPTPQEASWALENLIQRYGNVPEPIGPTREAFEAEWLSKHTKEGFIKREKDRLELAFGVHRLKTSDPFDIRPGLQIHANCYEGTYHGKKIGPHFHNTCVAPRVKLPEGAVPAEWLTQHLKVAFGLAVGAKCPNDLHPYYLYYAYGPMAGKAMNRVSDDHDKLRAYSVTKTQDRLLTTLSKTATWRADCPEAVFFVLECSNELDLKFLSYPNAEKHLRHWPHYFKNGLLPERQVALFKWLAGRGRANPLQDTLRFCEALYGKKNRTWIFKEEVDLTNIIGENDIDEALTLAEELGTGFEQDYSFVRRMIPIMSEDCALDVEQIHWFCGRIAREARTHPNRGKKIIHTAVEVLKGLSGEGLDKAWRAFTEYLSKHEQTDPVLAMLEAEPEAALRLPGLKPRPQEPGTALALSGTQGLVIQSDAWNNRRLALATGPGASARPSVALFKLYVELGWTGRDNYGRSWPIEAEYFDWLAPHLVDPLHPTKEALAMLKKMRDNVRLPDLERIHLCACMVSDRWTDQAFGHKGWDYKAEVKQDQKYKARACEVMGKVMDFARFGIFSEQEAVEIMELLLEKPIRHGAPELDTWERARAHSSFRSKEQCNHLKDSDVDWHIGLLLNDGLVAAKFYWMEQLLPALNDLMILSQMGLVPTEEVKALIQDQVAGAKENFVYKPAGKRLHADEVFIKTRSLRPECFTWAAKQNIDWSAVLAKHWQNMQAYIDNVTAWQEAFTSALNNADSKKAAKLNTTRPSEVELTETENDVLRFLEWTEQNYGWIRNTVLEPHFQTLLRETVYRMQAGEKIAYGTAQTQLNTAGEHYRAILTALGSIEDEHNRGLAEKLLLSAKIDLKDASAQATQLTRISAELDPAELEGILTQADTNPSTNIPALTIATRESSVARFRRAMPASGDSTLDRANAAVWAAFSSALERTGGVLEDRNLVIGLIDQLREQIRSARRESFGLPPLGSKIHFLKDLSEERIRALMGIAGLSDSGFSLDGHRALLLPAVPSGKELEIMVRALSTIGELRETDPQLHLCIGTRLPKRDTAILGSTIMLASTDMRQYARKSFMTSHEGLTAGRMMLYDDKGALSSLPFVRKSALETKGRTDMLARFARRDPVNYQLVGGVLADGVLGDQPFSRFAGPWKKRYREIIGDHGLSHIINETWIFNPGKETDSPKNRARHFANVTAVNNAYTACAHDFQETGRAEGIIFDVRDHVADLAEQIRPIQEEMLASSTYCKERQELLEF